MEHTPYRVSTMHFGILRLTSSSSAHSVPGSTADVIAIVIGNDKAGHTAFPDDHGDGGGCHVHGNLFLYQSRCFLPSR